MSEHDQGGDQQYDPAEARLRVIERTQSKINEIRSFVLATNFMPDEAVIEYERLVRLQRLAQNPEVLETRR